MAHIKDIVVEAMVEWFKKLEDAIDVHQITMENIYNMDETGITIMPLMQVLRLDQVKDLSLLLIHVFVGNIKQNLDVKNG